MRRAAPWLLGLFWMLLVTLPGWLHPTHVFGAPDQEADNHLWMHWQAVAADGPQLNWPVGEAPQLIDPVHVLITAWAMPLSPTLALLLMAMASVGLAAAGGYALSRELGADRQAALVGLTVLATAPVLGGLHVHGLTEDWPLGLYALHLAALLRTARTGSLRAAALAALALAGWLHAGWYATLFAAVGSPLVLWVLAREKPERRAWALILGAGAIAVLTVLPTLWALMSTEQLASVAARPLSRFNNNLSWYTGTPPRPPPWGADLATLWLPRPTPASFVRTVYLGLVTSALAGVAAWRRPRARRPLLAAVALCWLAAGPQVAAFGRGGLPGPASLLLASSGALHGVAGWYRAVGPAMVWLAPVAALGAGALPRTRWWWWVALVGLDALILSDAPWPRPHYDPSPPAALTELPGDGAVLLLPLDRGQTEWAPYVPRLYQRWQVSMGRPLANAYEAEMALGDEPLILWAALVCDGPTTRSLRPLPRVRTAGEPDVQALLAQGVDTIAVVAERLADPARCRERLSELLGEPTGERTWVWRLDRQR